MKTVGELSKGRDNNFNLLRFIAASAVILTHAFGLTGNGDHEPLSQMAGISMGSLAVDIFFVVSGFLICKSWESRRDPIGYFYARFLRIYPALWVSVLVVALVLGPLYTSLDLENYLTHIDTLKYILENCTLLIIGVFTTLPGVFDANPAIDVNSPLWTLPYELKMYILLALLGATGMTRRPSVVTALVLIALIGFFTSKLGFATPSIAEYLEAFRFIFFFFSGSLFYLYRHQIKLSWPMIIGISLLFVAIFMLLESMDGRRVAIAIFTPLWVIGLALLPGGFIRRFNELGDYSYGLYIFGMPIQQCVIASTGVHNTAFNFGISYGLTLFLAVLSWHLIEKRALALPLPRLIKPVQLKAMSLIDHSERR